MKYILSDEQLDILSYTKGYANSKLLISAIAGAAKTFVAIQIAKATPGKHLYLAFNKSIQLEAEKDFPIYTDCRTTASLAYQYSIYEGRTLNGSIGNSRSLGQFNWFNVNSKDRQVQDDTEHAMKDFCSSKFLTVDEFEKHRSYSHKVYSLLKLHILEMLNGDINATFEFSMKLFHKLLASKSVVLNYDYIFLDEVQDSSEVVLEIFKLLNAKTHVAVGDPQQAICGSFVLNTVNAFDVLDWPRKTLSKSFRCSTGIAETVQRFAFYFLDKTMVFNGNDYSEFEKLDGIENGTVAFISKTNAGLIKHMLELDAIGKEYSLVRDPKEIFKLALLVSKLGTSNLVSVKKYKKLPSDVKYYQDNEYLHIKYKTHLDYIASRNSKDVQLMSAINMVRKFGTSAISSAYLSAKRSFNSEAKYVLTSGHTSKGLTWDAVIIGDDFIQSLEPIILKSRTVSISDLPYKDKESLRLFYVAMTRARHKILNLPASISS